MFDWLAKKGENSRVYMCIKDLKWDLEARSPVNRAKVLAMSAIYREMFVEELGFSSNLFDNPFDYSRADLSKFYNVVETIRNSATHSLGQSQTMFKNFGAKMPQFLIQHVKTTNKAFEVWMGTIGVGLAAERRDEMRVVWSLLSGSSFELPNAMAELKKNELDTLRLFESNDRGVFADLNSEEWARSCDYTPKVFIGSLPI